MLERIVYLFLTTVVFGTMKINKYEIYKNHKNEDILFDSDNLSLFKLTRGEISRLKFIEKDKLFKNNKKITFNKKVNPRVKGIRIIVTENCNLRCRDCFVLNDVKNNKAMSINTAEKVTKKILKYAEKESIFYHFFGGEPLMNLSAIEKIVNQLNHYYKIKKIKRPFYGITTNATLINNKTMSFFKKNKFSVGVSVDGPPKINNKYRYYKDGRGTYNDVLKNYKILLKNKINSHILITPHKEVNNLSKIITSLLKDFRTQKITINTPLSYNDLHWNIDGKEYLKSLISVYRITKKKKVEIDTALSSIIIRLNTRSKRLSPCMFNDKNVFISVDPNGKLYSCPQKWNNHNLLIKNKVNVYAKNQIICNNCDARWFCGGTCPAYQVISNKNIDIEKCNFMKNSIKEFVKNMNLFI